MKTVFVEIETVDGIGHDAEKVMININQIAVIWRNSGTILMAGVHGDGHGLIHTTEKELIKIASAVGKIRQIEKWQEEKDGIFIDGVNMDFGYPTNGKP